MCLLKGRLIIEAKLLVKTGLHIGGGNSSIEIGGIDNSVIKNHKGEPYIPGSSLKGKLRSLTELAYGKTKEGGPCNCGECHVCKIYGIAAGSDQNKEGILSGRLIVRDAFLDENIRDEMKNKKGDFKELELTYTESKWENSIDRLKSSANPRVVERVPEGTVFNTEFIYNIYNEEDLDNLKELKKSFQFLEDDYIGGNGTRGYGKIKFEGINISLKTLKNYNKEEIVSEVSSLNNLDDNVVKKIKEKIPELNKQ